MATRKLWGEFEDDSEGEDNIEDETVRQSTTSSLHQNVNFNPIIELGMQNIPEIPITVKSSPIDLPKPNLITHTIQLHAYSRQLKALIEQAGNNTTLDAMSIPTMPPKPTINVEHEVATPLNFISKDACDFSLGKGPVVLPFTPESHQRALRQCAAIGLGQVGIATCTSTALNAVADALDAFLTNMCKVMRTVVDKEATGIKSGFPDVISKVLSDLNVGDLNEFYNIRVVSYHSKIMKKCAELRKQCEALVDKTAQEIKLDAVPELHFPATAFTPSLEPGLQMLHNLEEEQLHGLDLLDTVATDSTKAELMEFVQSETSSKLPTLSPSAKKKWK